MKRSVTSRIKSLLAIYLENIDANGFNYWCGWIYRLFCCTAFNGGWLLKDAEIYIVTIPTPIDASNHPDLTPLKNASQTGGQFLSEENIVIYESTVFSGATEEICVPILEHANGLTFNKHFYCGYSPERANP